MSEPYFWRYREQFEGNDDLDMLFMFEPSEQFVTEHPGELTIVTV